MPRGTIRFEDDDLNDRCFVFLDPHDITIENPDGYRVYRTHTEYKFATNVLRERFLTRVRERELLARFVAEKVCHRGAIVAQTKVIRFWQKPADNRSSLSANPKVTVSFLGRNEQQYEFDLGDFRRSPDIDGTMVCLTSVSDGTKTEFYFVASPGQKRKHSLSWRRRSSASKSPELRPQEGQLMWDADRFKQTFEAYHPKTWNPSPQIQPFNPSVQMQSFRPLSDMGSSRDTSPRMGAQSSTSSTLHSVATPATSIMSVRSWAQSRHQEPNETSKGLG